MADYMDRPLERDHAGDDFPHDTPYEHPRPDSDDIDERLLSLLRRLTHLLHHRMDNPHSHGQERILGILARDGKMTQRELLDHGEIRQASLSELLAKLEVAGYISRTRSETDRRNVIVEITDEGRKVAGQSQQERDSAVGSLFSSLDEVEKEELEDTLNKLLASWQRDGLMQDEHGGHGHHHGPCGHPGPDGPRGPHGQRPGWDDDQVIHRA